jgi:predicted RNA-binding protein with RPS1 domain
VVRGKIVDITNYGAFAELEDGIRGLIHKSKLAPGLVKRVEDVVSVGDELDLKVIDLDVNHRRIGLSLKAMHNKQHKPDNQPTLLGGLLQEELNRAASEKVNDSPPTKQQSEGGT